MLEFVPILVQAVSTAVGLFVVSYVNSCCNSKREEPVLVLLSKSYSKLDANFVLRRMFYFRQYLKNYCCSPTWIGHKEIL